MIMSDVDVISQAESVIKSLLHKDKYGNDVLDLKTNQIRKFLSAVNAVSNKVSVFKAANPNEKELSANIADEIRYLQVMLVYQIGREKADHKYRNKIGPIEEFENEAGLIKTIKSIGTNIEAFENFARYMESLVAYHKYYGGRD